jgi:hypothetical protein
MDENEMIELINHHAELTPEPGMAGVFYRDTPSSAALSSGTGQFLWFACMAETLEFLRDHAHDMNLGMGPMSMDPQPLRDQVEHFVDRAIAGDLPPNAMVTQLNIALEGYVEIDWVGQFEDLVLGEDDFALDVRRSFKRSQGEAGDDLQILNDQIDEFREFLPEYGLFDANLAPE